jgi:hypothetical protein
MKLGLSMSAVIVCLLFCANGIYAQDISAKTMAGINRVQIVVEEQEDVASGVLRTAELKSLVERKLRGRGIQLTPDSDRSDRYNYLYVNMMALSDSTGVSWAVSLEFKQGVTLLNGEFATATTWDKATIGTSPHSGVKSHVTRVTEGLLDQFIIDFLLANR